MPGHTPSRESRDCQLAVLTDQAERQSGTRLVAIGSKEQVERRSIRAEAQAKRPGQVSFGLGLLVAGSVINPCSTHRIRHDGSGDPLRPPQTAQADMNVPHACHIVTILAQPPGLGGRFHDPGQGRLRHSQLGVKPAGAHRRGVQGFIGVEQHDLELLPLEVSVGLEKEIAVALLGRIGPELGSREKLGIRPGFPPGRAGCFNTDRLHGNPGRNAREVDPGVLHSIGPDARTGRHVVLAVLPDPPRLDRRPWHPQSSAELAAAQVVFLSTTVVIADHNVIPLRAPRAVPAR